MGEILKKSFFCGVLIKFIKFFSDTFKQSTLKKILCNISLVFSKSSTKAIVIRYFDKKPVFFDSLLYRGIKALGRRLGKAADRINSAVSKIYGESFIKKVFDFIKSESMDDKLAAAGIFLMVVSISFLVFSIIFEKNAETRISLSWALFFIGILVVHAGRSIEIIKKSFVFKAVKYIVELVRM